MSGKGKGWFGAIQKARGQFVDGKQKEANRLRKLRTSSLQAATTLSAATSGNVICDFMNFPAIVIVLLYLALCFRNSTKEV